MASNKGPAFVAGPFFVYTFLMSWAARRRLLYIVGVILFFGVVLGVPIAYSILTVPPTCNDGVQNQDETAPDRGGVCPLADERSLSAVSPMWARSFRIRDGSYTAATYIQNTNEVAGAQDVGYRFKLYDSDNILITEREGSTYIMPGGITPVVETAIDTGNRIATHTFFEFTDRRIWKHYTNSAKVVSIYDRQLTNTDSVPREEAQVKNTSVSVLLNVGFVAVVFDTNGNAIAASKTELDRIEPNTSRPIVFTWPAPFLSLVGRVDIIPLLPPKAAWQQ